MYMCKDPCENAQLKKILLAYTFRDRTVINSELVIHMIMFYRTIRNPKDIDSLLSVAPLTYTV